MCVSLVILSLVMTPMYGLPQCSYSVSRIQSQSSPSSGSSGGSVLCECVDSHTDYTGNLNFAKTALARSQESRIELVLTHCHTLTLELNFDTIGHKQFNLRIEDSRDVHVVDVALVRRQQQVLVRRVDNLHLSGTVREVTCTRCGTQTGLLNIKVEDIGQFSMSKVHSSAPIKLTGRQITGVRIEESIIEILPWPGIFFYNASSVSVTRNKFLKAYPRSITISQGKQVEVSHNLLDVGEVLKLEQFDLMVVRCNRERQEDFLPAPCTVPELYMDTGVNMETVMIPESKEKEKEEDAKEEKKKEEEEEEEVEVEEIEDIWMTVLAVSDIYGFLWIVLSILLMAVFLLFYLIHSCCCRQKRKRLVPTPHQSALELAKQGPETNLTLQDEDGDEYSNSSRAHLSHGVDFIHDPLYQGRTPQFVRVQGVRSEPRKDGVLCGSLTLGTSYLGHTYPTLQEEGLHNSTRTSNILKKQTFSKV